MPGSDDVCSDMDPDDLTDDAIDALLEGSAVPAGYDDVAQVLAELRTAPVGLAEITVSAPLAEFVDPPGDPDGELIEVQLVTESMSPPPPRRQKMLSGLVASPAAKMALAAGVGLAGITGAHAAGLVDVPLLPDGGEPVEVVLADNTDDSRLDTPAPDPSPDDPAPQPVSEAEIAIGERSVSAQLGDVSLSLTITSDNGEMSIDIEVDGVSEACETALEALEDVSDSNGLGVAIEGAAEACGHELHGLLPDVGELEFGFRGGFGELGEDEFERFFGPDGFEGFEGFFDEQIVPFFGDDFDPERFLDPDRLEEFLGRFGRGEGTGGPFPEGLDPDELENFMNEFDIENLRPFLEGLDIEGFDELFENFEGQPFLDDFDFEQLQPFFEDFDMDGLDGLLEDFDMDGLDGLLEDFDFEQLQPFFEDFDLERFFGTLEPEEEDIGA